jgi:hypothetical protein
VQLELDLVSFLVGLVLGYPAGYLTHRAQLGVGRFKARSHRPETPEERIDNAAQRVERHWQDATIDEGARQLQAWYKDEGMAIPNLEEAKNQAKEMLNASVQGDTTVE